MNKLFSILGAVAFIGSVSGCPEVESKIPESAKCDKCVTLSALWAANITGDSATIESTFRGKTVDVNYVITVEETGAVVSTHRVTGNLFNSNYDLDGFAPNTVYVITATEVGSDNSCVKSFTTTEN